MGLDAVVYKHRSKLSVDPEQLGLKLEPDTGEWYSEAGSLPEMLGTAGVEAVHKRLGNVTLISRLGDEVRELMPAESMLLKKVLYEAAHAGDFVDLGTVVLLKREISELRSRPSDLSDDLAGFLDAIEDLIGASELNRNPIVFV